MASSGAVYDLVFRRVRVLDGTGGAERIADVAVGGERIAVVGDAVGRGATEIDGGGRCLAPGFIDVHTHDDRAVLVDPELPAKVLQGVTSVVVGNCGYSQMPGTGEVGRDVPQAFDTVASYLDRLDRAPASVNVATLIGHGSVRTAHMGLREPRAPSASELSAMAASVERGLADGALGLSTGLAYEPGRYAKTDEVVSLAARLGPGGLYTTHLRDEGAGLLASVEEAIAIGERAGVRVQISHHKAAGRGNWGAVHASMALIDAARARGVDVMADQYPYTRGSTLLEQIVNAGALAGESPFGHLDGDGILVAAAPGHPEWEGRTLTALAAGAGVDAVAMADRIVAAEGRACFVVIDIMSEDDVHAVLAHPVTMIGSDGIPEGSKPHPRQHHTFPRVLGRYVRELRVLDLPTAIHRMTGMSARRFGLAGRGHVAPGAFADLVLFDADTIADTGTYADPTTVPAGIDGVWVNGRRVAEAGRHTGARPGRTLRRTF